MSWKKYGGKTKYTKREDDAEEKPKGRPKPSKSYMPKVHNETVSIREYGVYKGIIEFEFRDDRDGSSINPIYFYKPKESRALSTFVDARRRKQDKGSYLCLVTRVTETKDDRFMLIASDIHDITGWVEQDKDNLDTRKVIVFHTYDRPMRSQICPPGEIPLQSVVYDLEMITTQFERYTPGRVMTR